MRNAVLCLIFVSASFSSVFAQCDSATGVCNLRTPVRSALSSIAEAKPVRRVVQTVRPANWRVFNQGSVSANCSGVAVQSSCSQSVAVPQQVIYCEPVTGSAVVVDSTSPSSIGSVDQSSVVETFGFRSDRVAFRRSLKKATRSAVAAGSITEAEAGIINAMAFFPGKAESMMAAVHDMAVDQGLATTQAIDWDGLAGFLERILPIILKLIELFGSIQGIEYVDGLVIHFDHVSVEFLVS